VALKFPNPHGALLDLLNLQKANKRTAFYGRDRTAEHDFILRHGPLRPVPSIAALLPKVKGSDEPRVALRVLWSAFVTALAMNDQTKSEPAAINDVLARIFNVAEIDGEIKGPGLKVDILAGTVKPVSRDLLDAVAIEFMQNYKRIGRCERCETYFYKDYITDRYCSSPCAEKSRREAQRDWMRNKRAEQKRNKQAGRKPKRRVQ